LVILTFLAKGVNENIFIILHFKPSNINTLWKREVEILLMQRSSRFRDFCTTYTIFILKIFLVNQLKICSISFLFWKYKILLWNPAWSIVLYNQSVKSLASKEF